jgi:Lar family restriction alleviation protein
MTEVARPEETIDVEAVGDLGERSMTVARSSETRIDQQKCLDFNQPAEDVVLLKCPFCGGEPAFFNDDAGIEWIACLTCFAHSTFSERRSRLVEYWNRRVGA